MSYFSILFSSCMEYTHKGIIYGLFAGLTLKIVKPRFKRFYWKGAII